MTAALPHITLHSIGALLFGLFVFVLMIDPTNAVLHAKEPLFCLVVAYNAVVFKPDWTKLPLIIILVLSILLPYLISVTLVRPFNEDEAFALFKSVMPSVLLLWVGRYNLVSIARAPVVICCLLIVGVYVTMLANPLAERLVYKFAMDRYEALCPFNMSRRYILGFRIFGFYLKSFVSFVFVAAYYIYALFDKRLRSLPSLLALCFILFAFLVSGTRSTMLVPFFLVIVIGFRVYRHSRRLKYVMLPAVFALAVAFVSVLIMAMTETGEQSNIVKYGHIASYLDLFDANPLYMLIGQGPGTSFYSDGFGTVVYRTEWSYLEILRQFGVFSLGIVGVFFLPMLTFWRNRTDDTSYCVFWAYLAYLLIAGTNPLLLSSTGMLSLLMAYSVKDYIAHNKRTSTTT